MGRYGDDGEGGYDDGGFGGDDGGIGGGYGDDPRKQKESLPLQPLKEQEQENKESLPLQPLRPQHSQHSQQQRPHHGEQHHQNRPNHMKPEHKKPVHHKKSRKHQKMMRKTKIRMEKESLMKESKLPQHDDDGPAKFANITNLVAKQSCVGQYTINSEYGAVYYCSTQDGNQFEFAVNTPILPGYVSKTAAMMFVNNGDSSNCKTTGTSYVMVDDADNQYFGSFNQSSTYGVYYTTVILLK